MRRRLTLTATSASRLWLRLNLAAIYCVGETLKEFEANQAEDVIRAQILVGLMGLKAEDMKNIIIAYEPVWSIGTGKNASEEIAENICKYIRGIIASMFGKKVAEETIILYGGSVKPNNIHGYLAQEDVDGALVGGASLTSESFKELIQNV
jgi:triosephosphate isomerase